MTVNWIRLVAWVDETKQLWLFQKPGAGQSEFVFRAIVFGPSDETFRDFSTADDGRRWLETLMQEPRHPDKHDRTNRRGEGP